LEERAQLEPSLGQESHHLDAIAQTLGQDMRWMFCLEAKEETLEDLT
jgi:hypothetical protein